MSDPDRVLPPMVELPTHADGMKDCFVATSTAVHAATLESGKSYATLVHYQKDFPVGCGAFFDREEGEALIELIRFAMDDADRLNAGKPALALSYDPDRRTN